MEKKINELIDALKREIEGVYRMVLESDVGINDKVGTNTLADSNLHKELETNNEDFTFHLYYNFYAEYIESGRKPMARKVPIGAILKWMERKLHTTDASVAYAIRESIYKNGIKPRPILAAFNEELDKAFERWAVQLFDAITSDLTRFFN